MVMALHHPERVPFHVLARHEPRLVFAAAAPRALFLDASDAQPLALAQRIETQPLVLPDDAAALVLDRARFLRNVAVQEFAERPVADEADPGGVLLPGIRQAGLLRDPTHLGLAQL